MIISTLYFTSMLGWSFIVLVKYPQSVEKNVTPLGHIILIPSQSVFALTP
jgi:hypothetical protein